MIKKILSVLIVFVLLTYVGIPAFAQTKIFGEYEQQGGKSGSGLTFGYEWDLDPLWYAAFDLKYDGADNSSVTLGGELSCRIAYGVSGAVRTELGNSHKSLRFRLMGQHDLTKDIQFTESLGYTSTFNSTYSGSDNNELKLQIGLSKEVTRMLDMFFDATWTSVHFSSGIGNVDYTKWELIPELRYSFSPELRASVGYALSRTSLGESRNNFILGADYIKNNYNYYIEVPIPTDGRNILLGLSYKY